MKINSNNQIGFGCGYCASAQQKLVKAGLSNEEASAYVSRSISDIDFTDGFIHGFDSDNPDLAENIINKECNHESRAAFVADFIKNSANTIVENCKKIL